MFSDKKTYAYILNNVWLRQTKWERISGLTNRRTVDQGLNLMMLHPLRLGQTYMSIIKNLINETLKVDQLVS